MANWYCGSAQWTAVTAWASGTAYVIGDIRRQLAAPSVGNERVWRCTTAGTSGGAEPTWTLTAGSTTADNTVVWTEITGQSSFAWTAAHARLSNNIAWIAAGDTIYISDNHAETQSSSSTITAFPGTAGNPNFVLCVSHLTSPPTAVTTGATVSTTGTSNITFSNGFAYFYGVAIQAASTGTSVTASIIFNNSLTWGYVFDTCQLVMGSTSGTPSIQIGTTAGGSRDQFVKLINTKITFSAAAQRIINNNGVFMWLNTTPGLAGTVPTNLFAPPATTGGGRIELSGVDLSTMGSGKNLINSAGGLDPAQTYLFRNCKLGASVTVISGAVGGWGAIQVFLDNCDSSGTNYRMEHYKFQGSIVNETTKVRTSGASDGTTPLSHKLVSLASGSGPTLYSPLEGPWINIWNDTSGSSKTVTVEFLHDSLTNLQNSDIYLEVEGLGTASFPESVYYNNRVADAFATPADCPAGIGTGNWTTSGLTNPNSQKLAVSFTPQLKGPIRARVCLAKVNYTVYVDPVLTIT